MYSIIIQSLHYYIKTKTPKYILMSQLQLINDIDNIPPRVDVVEHLKGLYGKRGVKVNYEISGDIYSRIMLSTFRRSCSFEYSGTILGYNADMKRYEIVSIPHSPPTTQFKMSYIQSKIKECSTICVRDGTTVTLYYYNGEWRISTHRGIDVGNIKWSNNRTYTDILSEVLKVYEFKYDALDVGKCYTIGFKHNDYHPFLEGKDKIRKAWFICSADISKFIRGDSDYISYTDNIGIPIQLMVPTTNICSLVENASEAYAKYKSSGEINYGYIFKIGRKHYLMESSLMSNIRQIFYSNKFRELTASVDKTKYIVAHSFLSAKHYSVFKVLFPQYSNDFNNLNNIIVGLVNDIVRISLGETLDKKHNVSEIAYMLHDDISKKIRINGTRNTRMLFSYMYNTRHTELLYMIAYGQ
jgi:hypothetical protein